ncbi:MAPEG family protein [Teredinibacter waterburyi]|jgi:Predicted membrane protein|uniref:MAPEG family protein n=1 Tax=Teredinibacter waterburyi TaxID=1500538 RepID=UPI00165FEF5E|nr:MAPEG family protein [Teredinibacter waterburyi]
MISFQTYDSALFGIFVVIATLVVQSLIASFIKAKQPGAIPGKIDESLGHESIVYRAHRTFMNSLENTPTMLAAAFLAIFSGADAKWTAIFVWVYAVARLIHMLGYYFISTSKNPSPRSYFFLIGFIATIALLVLSAISIL